MTKDGECLSMGVEESSANEKKVEPIFEGEGANAIRTDLRMQGNPQEFIEKGGAKSF
jgi:hypothetical protein